MPASVYTEGMSAEYVSLTPQTVKRGKSLYSKGNTLVGRGPATVTTTTEKALSLVSKRAAGGSLTIR